MAEPQIDEIARYGRWLKRSVGTTFRIGVGNTAGELLWADGNDAAPLARALATCIALPHDGSEGMRRQEADDAAKADAAKDAVNNATDAAKEAAEKVAH